jgi:hypothetical protein
MWERLRDQLSMEKTVVGGWQMVKGEIESNHSPSANRHTPEQLSVSSL